MAANRFKWADALRDHGDIDAYGFAVAFALFLHMNKNGKCFLDSRTISRESHVHRNTVLDRLDEMRKDGWIDWEDRGRNRARRYEATIPSGTYDVPPSGTRDEPPSGTPVVHGSAPSGTPHVHEPPTNLREVGGEGAQPASADATAAAPPENNDKTESMKQFLDYVWTQRTHSNWKPDSEDKEDPDFDPQYWWGDRVGYSDIDTGNPDLLAEVSRLDVKWQDWELVDVALRRPPREPKSPTGWLLSVLRKLPDDPADNVDALSEIQKREAKAKKAERLGRARRLLEWLHAGGLNGQTWTEKMAQVEDPVTWEEARHTCIDRRWLVNNEVEEEPMIDYLGYEELEKIGVLKRP